jgi:AraC-like DNA-binding protein
MVSRRIGDDMFFYITKGRGTASIEGHSLELTPGVCAHFRRGQSHSASTDPSNPVEVIALHYTATVFESLTWAELLQFPVAFNFVHDHKADAMFHEACREFALRPVGHQRGLEALVTRLLFHLVRQHGNRLAFSAEEGRLADLRRLLPALEFIRGNIGQDIFVSQLARLAGFSESQFRRVFLRTMSASPVQYLRRIRMEHACELLRQTDETVERIAGEVGYGEPAFFAHSFKKLIGVSPGKYRRTHEL